MTDLPGGRFSVARFRRLLASVARWLRHLRVPASTWLDYAQRWLSAAGEVVVRDEDPSAVRKDQFDPGGAPIDTHALRFPA